MMSRAAPGHCQLEASQLQLSYISSSTNHAKLQQAYNQVDSETMVKYLELTYIRNMFETANSDALTARCWYEIFYSYFFQRDAFAVGPFMEKAARIPKRRFPMVEHQYCKDKASPSRSTRAILVEVMDPNDPELSWDVMNSGVYEELKDLGLVHPERKSFGILSAGSNFVLFEVTGRSDPVFLLGEPTKLAHFVIDAEPLEQEMQAIHKVARAGMCKCSDPEEVTFRVTVKESTGPFAHTASQ